MGYLKKYKKTRPIKPLKCLWIVEISDETHPRYGQIIGTFVYRPEITNSRLTVRFATEGERGWYALPKFSHFVQLMRPEQRGRFKE